MKLEVISRRSTGTNGIIYGFDIAVEEADFVDAFNGFEDLQAQTEASRQREGASRLGASQFS